jgi:acylphosphatase
METGAHIVVAGLVQGVGFRWYTARKAEALGLCGYVHNRYDGGVEIIVEGDRSLVEELIKEVKIGPRSAHVSDLRIEWVAPTGLYHRFDIR